ncbi:MAG TPA: tetratricopeptide repeat protein [Pyrinomonadaceae bacterium]|nr:tetratricopeptide repeat protein [Pyrinomonadaceae bacterium]
MTKNILLSLAGILLGFFLGFTVANFGGRPRLAANPSTAPSSNTTAGPLEPGQGGQLPPGHPNIGDNGAGSAPPAATSAQAQAAMDEADRNPKDFTAQIRAAAIFFQLGSMDKAELYLNRSLALKPDDPDALTGMGQTKYETGDYAGAATYFEKVLAKNPADADLRTDLGNTYAKRTPPDYARAMTEYRKALESDPKNEQALEGLANSALLKGDKATARDAVDKLASVNPSNPALSSLRSKLDGR